MEARCFLVDAVCLEQFLDATLRASALNWLLLSQALSMRKYPSAPLLEPEPGSHAHIAFYGLESQCTDRPERETLREYACASWEQPLIP